MIKFKEYLKEAHQYKDGTLDCFDIDDTLFHTTAKIGLIKGGKVVRSLTNNEFNTYQLKAGESFDFSQFRDALKFNLESKPMGAMINKAKAIISQSEYNINNKVIILTARDDFDNKDVFLDTFKKHGFDMNKVRVERAGKIKDLPNVAFAKAVIIGNYLNTKQFSKVRLFDDALSNLHTFLKLKASYPSIEFKAYFVKPDGTVRSIKG